MKLSGLGVRREICATLETQVCCRHLRDVPQRLQKTVFRGMSYKCSRRSRRSHSTLSSVRYHRADGGFMRGGGRGHILHATWTAHWQNAKRGQRPVASTWHNGPRDWAGGSSHVHAQECRVSTFFPESFPCGCRHRGFHRPAVPDCTSFSRSLHRVAGFAFSRPPVAPTRSLIPSSHSVVDIPPSCELLTVASALFSLYLPSPPALCLNRTVRTNRVSIPDYRYKFGPPHGTLMLYCTRG